MTNAELVEKIKRILEDSENSTPEEQQEAARLYASRLRRIEDGFRKALGQLNNGELADADRILTDGSLLEDYAALTLPAAEDWRVVCRTFDYEVAPATDAAARDRLATFQKDFAPLRDVFAKRRRQAMENAPSRSQLETLYYLEEKLGARDFITRQIERLERRRSEELAEAVKGLNEENVFSVDFKALVAEIRDPRRHTQVPRETVDKYRSWLDFYQSRQELANLRDLIARWEVASANQDANAALALLAEYRSGEFRHAAPYVTQDETNTLSSLVDQALKIERAEELREDARRKVSALRSALVRSSNDANKLHDLYEAASIASNNAGASIPADVEKDYNKQVGALNTQSRRRRMAAIAFTVVTVAFFATLAALSVVHTRNVKLARSVAESVGAQLDAFEKRSPDSAAALDAAAALVAKYAEERPKLAEIPEYSAVVERFNSLQTAEKKRLHDIEDLVDAIDEAHGAGRAVPASVESLKKLLYNDKEKEKYDYARLYREDSNLAHAKNTAGAERYSELVDALAAKEREFEENSAITVPEAKKALAELRSGVEELKSQEQFAEIARPLVAAREALEAAVDGSERRFKLRAALDKHGAALAKAVGNASDYAKTLKAIRADTSELSASGGEDVADATKDALDAALDAAIEDVANAKGATAWNSFAKSWGSVNASAQNLSASDKAAKELQKTELKFAPELEPYRQARAALDGFAKRGGYESAAKSLAGALEKYETPTWVFFDSKEERYFYLTSDPQEGRSGLKYLSEVEGGATRDFAADRFEESTLASTPPSAQYMIAGLAAKRLSDKPAPEDWIAVVDGALRALDVAPETTLDPVVKLQLLAVVVDSAKLYPGFDELTKWLEETRRSSDFDFAINAYQPGRELLEARESAKKALRDAPDLEKSLAAAKTAFDEGERSFACEYRWIGYLDEVNSAATLALGAGKTVDEGASLWVARGADATAEEIGTMTADGASFNTAKDWATYRWTPVYARVETAKQ